MSFRTTGGAGGGSGGGAESLGVAAGTRGYGTSLIGAQTHVDNPADRYFTKVSAHLGAYAKKNFGVGGSTLLEQTPADGWVLTWAQAVDELPQPAGTLAGLARPPREGLFIFDFAINDIGEYGDQSGFQNTFYYGLAAGVAQARADFVWQAGANGPGHGRFTTTGWTNASSADFGGDYVHKTSGPATITHTTESAFPGGDLVYFIAQSILLGENCVVSGKIGSGPTLFTLDTTGLGVTAPGGLTGPATIIPLFVPDVPAGSNVITLTFSTINVNMNFLGGVAMSEWAPVVLLMNQPSPMGNPLASPPATWPLATQTRVDATNATIERVADYYQENYDDTGAVAVVDRRPMSSTASFWIPGDDLHFSPEGHSEIAVLTLREIDRAGGIPSGYSAGPDPTTDGPPGWSGSPGDEAIIDPATGIEYTPTGISTWGGKQPVAQYLLDVAATDPAANDDIFQLKAGTVVARTPNQYAADLIAAGLYTMVPAGTVTFSALGTTLVAEPTAVAMVALIGGLGGPTFDTHANRIAASHQAGVYWIETDTGLQYYDDGATWRIISPLGQVLKLGNSQVISGDPASNPTPTTLRDITELVFPVEAGERWEVVSHLWVTADGTTTDLKLFYTLPGGAGDTFTIIKTGDLTTPATGTNPVLANVDAISQMGSASGIFEAITTTEVTVGANAGNVQLRAAQIVGGGVGHDTTIGGKANGLTSSLRLRKLGAL